MHNLLVKSKSSSKKIQKNSGKKEKIKYTHTHRDMYTNGNKAAAANEAPTTQQRDDEEDDEARPVGSAGHYLA